MSLMDYTLSRCQKCECKCHLDVTQEKQKAGKIDDNNFSQSWRSGKMNITTDNNFIRTNCLESNANTHGKVQSAKDAKEFNYCQGCLKSHVQWHHVVSNRGKPCTKFVWNNHMLKDVNDLVHPDWLLYITHGFVGQCSILSLI